MHIWRVLYYDNVYVSPHIILLTFFNDYFSMKARHPMDLLTKQELLGKLLLLLLLCIQQRKSQENSVYKTTV